MVVCTPMAGVLCLLFTDLTGHLLSSAISKQFHEWCVYLNPIIKRYALECCRSSFYSIESWISTVTVNYCRVGLIGLVVISIEVRSYKYRQQDERTFDITCFAEQYYENYIGTSRNR